MKNTKPGSEQRGNPLRVVIWGVAAFALLLPLVAMQFTSEVDWGLMDFVVFGVMLLVACGAYELATRLLVTRTHRLAVGITLLAAFLLTWATLAVDV